jgi:hypothetical protein
MLAKHLARAKIGICVVAEGLLGAQGRNRTTDTVIFSHVLYQLSNPLVALDASRAMEAQLQCDAVASGRSFVFCRSSDAKGGVGLRRPCAARDLIEAAGSRIAGGNVNCFVSAGKGC